MRNCRVRRLPTYRMAEPFDSYLSIIDIQNARHSRYVINAVPYGRVVLLRVLMTFLSVEIATPLTGFAMTLTVKIVFLDIFEDTGVDHVADVGAGGDALAHHSRRQLPDRLMGDQCAAVILLPIERVFFV